MQFEFKISILLITLIFLSSNVRGGDLISILEGMKCYDTQGRYVRRYNKDNLYYCCESGENAKKCTGKSLGTDSFSNLVNYVNMINSLHSDANCGGSEL